MEIEKVAKIEHILNLDYSDPKGRQAIDKTLRSQEAETEEIRQTKRRIKQYAWYSSYNYRHNKGHCKKR